MWAAQLLVRQGMGDEGFGYAQRANHGPIEVVQGFSVGVRCISGVVSKMVSSFWLACDAPLVFVEVMFRPKRGFLFGCLLRGGCRKIS